MIKRTCDQLGAGQSRAFAPGVIEQHKQHKWRHVRILARWFGRALVLLLLAAVLAAVVSIYQRGGA